MLHKLGRGRFDARAYVGLGVYVGDQDVGQRSVGGQGEGGHQEEGIINEQAAEPPYADAGSNGGAEDGETEKRADGTLEVILVESYIDRGVGVRTLNASSEIFSPEPAFAGIVLPVEADLRTCFD